MGGERKYLVVWLSVCVALVCAAPAAAYVPGDLTELGCVSQSSTLASELVEGCGTRDGHGLLGAGAIAISPDGTSAYVASGDGFSGQVMSNALATFARDPATGALSETGCVGETSDDCETRSDGLSAVSDVKVSPDGTRVYVASAMSGVTVFDRAAGGALTPAGCFKDPGETTADFTCTPEPGFEGGGARSIAVSADSQYVYAATQNGNAIAEFKRSGGSLTYLGCVSGDSGNTSCSVKTDLGLLGVNGLAIDPAGDRLYATAYASNSLDVFTLNSTTGLITGELGCDSLVTGGGEPLCADDMVPGLSNAQNVAVSADGSRVYTTSLDGAVASFAEKASGPGVTPLGCVGAAAPATPTPGCTSNAGIGLRGASDIVLVPNPAPGTVAAYVTGFFDNAVAELALDPSTGALVPLPSPNGCVTGGAKTESCPGPDAAGLNGAEGLSISPDGNYVYVSSRGVGLTHPGCGLMCTDTVAAVAAFSRFAAPAVATTVASAVGVTSAELHGTVNPEGAPTTYRFQLGTSPSLLGAVSLPAASAGAGVSGVAVQAAAGGLKPDTTYYYRLVASNTGGAASSAPATHFMTPPATVSSSVTVGNLRVTVTRPAITGCLSSGQNLGLAFKFKTLKSRHPKVRSVRVRIYVDAHVRGGLGGGVPGGGSDLVELTRLKHGTHTLKVVVSFRERHATVRRTLRTKFVIC